MTGLHEVEPHECVVRISIDGQNQQSMAAPTLNAILEGNLIIPKVCRRNRCVCSWKWEQSTQSKESICCASFEQCWPCHTSYRSSYKEEEEVDIKTRQHRFNIDLLSKRLVAVTDWIMQNPDTQKLFVGYFGASTGAAAALVAAG